MILYHYTDTENLPSIRVRGLIPHAVPNAARNDDPAVNAILYPEPIVWLTNDPTDNVAQPARLTVRLEANSKRLVPYVEWLRKHHPNFKAAMRDATMTGIAFDRWYVYRGTISPNKIDGLATSAEM